MLEPKKSDFQNYIIIEQLVFLIPFYQTIKPKEKGGEDNFDVVADEDEGKNSGRRMNVSEVRRKYSIFVHRETPQTIEI